MNVNLKSLIEKLTPSARNALESAAGLCVTRTHYDVEVEHYLMKLLDDGPGDFEKIRRRFGVDDSRLSADLARSLDALKSGNARVPAFSPTIVKMLSAAWQVGSLEFGHEEIRTGATILALVSDPELARMTREISKELQKIDAQALQTEFGAILAGSPEDMENAVASPWSEYKKYFEKDAALARRFQVVKVEEPEELQCMVMLRGIAPALEKPHGVRILDEAVQSAVRLSHRYMVGRQ